MKIAFVLPGCGCSGGLVEIVKDHETGFIVPEKDIEAMAEAMTLLAEDNDLRARMGQAARKRMKEKFDINKQNAIWRQMAHELMSIGKR